MGCRNAWLQITVLASSPDTCLLTDDVFYFGNFVGEVGNQASPGFTTAADLAAIRDHPHGPSNPAGIDDRYDINRDARVDAADLILARNSVGSPLDSLRMIVPPVPTSPPPMESEPLLPSDALDGRSGSLKRPSAVEYPLLIDLLLGM